MAAFLDCDWSKQTTNEVFGFYKYIGDCKKKSFRGARTGGFGKKKGKNKIGIRRKKKKKKKKGKSILRNYLFFK